MCSTRRKKASTPSKLISLTPYVGVVMRLAMRVDEVTITARVAIILVTADDGADDTAGHCTDGGSSTRADARKDRTG